MPLSARHGKNTIVVFGNLDLTEYLNEISTSHEIETGETTTFGDEAKTYITGLEDATISASGLFGTHPLSLTITGALEDIQQYSTFWYQLTWADSRNTGARAKLAQVQLVGLEISSPVSDVVSISLEWQPSRQESALYDFSQYSGIHAGVLLAYGGIETTTEFPAVDNGVATDGGIIMNGTIGWGSPATPRPDAVRLQHSADGVSWADLNVKTFTGGSGWSGSLYFPGTIQRYVRLKVETPRSINNLMYAVARK